MRRNDPCFCGSGKKWKKCHFPQHPGDLKERYLKNYGIILKGPEAIEGISKACQISKKILKKLCDEAKIGVTTNHLNDLANELHKKEGAKPAPLGYGDPPFPKSICTSINDVICHGIPDDIPLKDGDILNIDVTSIVGGFYGDCSRMVEIGNISKEKKLLIKISYECLMMAIDICKPGRKIFEIGNIIENHAKKYGFSVVNQFVGHGVGIAFHEPPQIPHHTNNINVEMVEGMTFTIEPMINLGVREAVIDPENKWTARTKDGKDSAQWEHTIAITKDGHKILTV